MRVTLLQTIHPRRGARLLVLPLYPAAAFACVGCGMYVSTDSACCIATDAVRHAKTSTFLAVMQSAKREESPILLSFRAQSAKNPPVEWYAVQTRTPVLSLPPWGKVARRKP